MASNDLLSQIRSASEEYTPENQERKKSATNVPNRTVEMLSESELKYVRKIFNGLKEKIVPFAAAHWSENEKGERVCECYTEFWYALIIEPYNSENKFKQLNKKTSVLTIDNPKKYLATSEYGSIEVYSGTSCPKLYTSDENFCLDFLNEYEFYADAYSSYSIDRKRYESNMVERTAGIFLPVFDLVKTESFWSGTQFSIDNIKINPRENFFIKEASKILGHGISITSGPSKCSVKDIPNSSRKHISISRRINIKIVF